VKELIENYINGKTDAITVIRTLSGAFNPDHAIDILLIICMITRVEQGDLEKDLFKELVFGKEK